MYCERGLTGFVQDRVYTRRYSYLKRANVESLFRGKFNYFAMKKMGNRLSIYIYLLYSPTLVKIAERCLKI